MYRPGVEMVSFPWIVLEIWRSCNHKSNSFRNSTGYIPFSIHGHEARDLFPGIIPCRTSKREAVACGHPSSRVFPKLRYVVVATAATAILVDISEEATLEQDDGL